MLYTYRFRDLSNTDNASRIKKNLKRSFKCQVILYFKLNY